MTLSASPSRHNASNLLLLSGHTEHGRACCSLDPVATDPAAKFLLLPFAQRRAKGQLAHKRTLASVDSHGAALLNALPFAPKGTPMAFGVLTSFSRKLSLIGGFLALAI